jgi:hypothetical protein
LLTHVGVNLERINKSYDFLDEFVGYFTTILQNAWSNYQDLQLKYKKLYTELTFKHSEAQQEVNMQ